MRRPANRFIKTEFGAEGDSSEDESDGNNYTDDFTVVNHIEY